MKTDSKKYNYILKWKAKHPEKLREYRKRWAEKHPAEQKLYIWRWKQKHPNYMQEWKAKHPDYQGKQNKHITPDLKYERAKLIYQARVIEKLPYQKIGEMFTGRRGQPLSRQRIHQIVKEYQKQLDLIKNREYNGDNNTLTSQSN